MYGCRFNRLSDYLFCLCLFAVSGFSVDASAQMSPQTTAVLGQWWQATSAGFQALPPGTPGGFQVATIPQVGGLPAGGVSLTGNVGGWPSAGVSGTPRGLPGGAVVDVTAKIKPAAFGAALARFASKVVTPLTVGMAVYDLAKELGFSFGANDTYSKTDPSVCTVAPCTGYMINGRYPTTTVYPTLPAACSAFAADISTNNPNYNASVSSTSPTCVVRLVSKTTGDYVGDSSGGVYPVSVQPSPAGNVVATRQDFVNAVAAKSGWPSESRVVQAVADVISSGEPVELESPKVSGPASSRPAVSTKSRSDGSTETTTTTNNYTYTDNKVNVTSSTVVQNYNPVSNVTTTDTTTNNSVPPSEQAQPCEQNPDSVGCGKLDTLPEGVIPKETKNVAYAVESLNWGVSASCPAAMSFNAPVTGKSFQLEYTPFCDVASRMRPFILAGAAFVAMMIVMAGVKA